MYALRETMGNLEGAKTRYGYKPDSLEVTVPIPEPTPVPVSEPAPEPFLEPFYIHFDTDSQLTDVDLEVFLPALLEMDDEEENGDIDYLVELLKAADAQNSSSHCN